MNWFELGCELQCLGGLVKKRKKIEIWSYNFCLCPVKAVSASGAKKILISWHMKAQTSWERDRDRERHRHRETHRLKAGKGNIYVGFKFMKILNTAITWGFRIINKQKRELPDSLCWEPHINASCTLIMNYSVLCLLLLLIYTLYMNFPSEANQPELLTKSSPAFFSRL